MELLAPAGNFDVAIAAFQSGADAVYLGLKDFSARKRAENFTDEQLRRLKQYAIIHGKKIYITLNTLISNDEWKLLRQALHFIQAIEVDGVIIQDLGLCQLIRQFFPKIPIHASTQMAIHSVAAAKVAHSLGIERVVLSRECSYEQIKKIREEVPELEIEVFIHGALCYSFSGLCLASGLMLDRSGNRGECAQICRTYFDNSAKQSAYPFSCNDLALRGEISKLVNLGISSFKIEGRMKSAEYVSSTVGYYRSLLDGKEAIKLLEQSQLSFARKLSYGYFHSARGEELINSAYAGHFGIFAGKMKRVGGVLLLPTEIALSAFDTLAFFRSGQLITRCQLKRATVHGKRVDTIRQNQPVQFELPPEVKEADEVRLIGQSEKAMPGLDYKRFALFKIPLSLDVTLEENRLRLSAPSGLDYSRSVTWQERLGEKSIYQALQDQLDRSGDSLFHFIISSTHHEPTKYFLPPSELKEIRREIYLQQEKIWNDDCQQLERFELPNAQLLQSLEQAPLLRRSLFLHDGFPFAQDVDDLKLEMFAQWQNHYVIPLSPLQFDEEAYYNALIKLFERYPENSFLLGINNLAHLNWISMISNKFANCSFYGDYALYLANSASLQFLIRNVPRLRFAYSWCESAVAVPGATRMQDASCLPLFISRGCYRLHQGKSCSDCSKNFKEDLVNGKRKFEVRGKRCLTYLFFK